MHDCARAVLRNDKLVSWVWHPFEKNIKTQNAYVALLGLPCFTCCCSPFVFLQA